MNIDNIKKEFPIFDNKVQNNDLVYLDSANSSQKPHKVINRIYDFYTKEFSNVGRSVHYLAVAATNFYENTNAFNNYWRSVGMAWVLFKTISYANGGKFGILSNDYCWNLNNDFWIAWNI